MTKTTSGLREMQVDPTQNLLDSLNSNSFSRIRSALQVPHRDLNYRDPESESQTLLMRICLLDLTERSRCDLMKMVLDKPGMKLEVNSQDGNGMSAVSHACKIGDEAMVRLLARDANVDPNLPDFDGNTPLMHACCSGNTNVTTTLVACFGNELNVDQSNNLDMTPLMEAARRGYLELCRTLVTIGHADVSLRSGVENFTAKDYAVQHGRCNTPDLLILNSVAQRKVRARQARKAMGRSILNDLCPEMRLARPILSAPKPFDNTVRQLRDLPLSKEYIEQMNSIVFQVGKHLQRLPEDLDGEARETVCDLPLYTKKNKPRRMSLNEDALQADVPVKLSKLLLRRKSIPLSDKGIKLASAVDGASHEIVPVSTSTSRPKSKSSTLKLPRVSRTTKGAPQNLSTSPPSPRTCMVHSPRRTPKDLTQSTNVSVVRAGSSRSSSKNTGNWAGKSSTSVPSYLFR